MHRKLSIDSPLACGVCTHSSLIRTYHYHYNCQDQSSITIIADQKPPGLWFNLKLRYFLMVIIYKLSLLWDGWMDTGKIIFLRSILYNRYEHILCFISINNIYLNLHYVLWWSLIPQKRVNTLYRRWDRIWDMKV